MGTCGVQDLKSLEGADGRVSFGAQVLGAVPGGRRPHPGWDAAPK